MIISLTILIHSFYLALYFLYLRFLDKFEKEKIIFLLLLIYFFLPGRFYSLNFYDIYFHKIYIFLFLFPLFLKELFLFFDGAKNKNKRKNYLIFLFLIPFVYLIFQNLDINDLNTLNLEYKRHYKNYLLDFFNSIMFIIFFMNTRRIDLIKLYQYVKKFIYIASYILIAELIFFFIFEKYISQLYDKSGVFNSIFFSSFFVTSLFSGIAILFFINDLIIKKKFFNIILLIFLSLIILINIESRAIILSLSISVLTLFFINFKKNLIIKFTIIFLFLFLAKLTFNFDQCTLVETNIYKILNKINIKSKNLCDYESSYYRYGLLKREIDVILSNLPFGVGPGVGKFYYNDKTTENYLYPTTKSSYKIREVYADILDVHFENSQLLPPQASNILSHLLMSYGINIFLILFLLFNFISFNYKIQLSKILNINTVAILFVFLNYIFNSTSGLIFLQIVMTLLALTYKEKIYVKSD